ncbi:MAG: Gx transporter family protein [Clostridia bacterium]|nr:Gx transporter family protein [Clostridia bacterium]
MAKRIVTDAVLAAVALVLFVVEAQIPPIVPIPGVKLGLANIVTVWALMRIGAADALGITLVRIALGSVFTGTLPSFIFSLSGGLLAFAAILLLKKMLSENQIFVAGVVGAIFHNAGQLTAAAIMYGTASVFVWSPVLVLSGIVTGLFTGLVAQLLSKKIPKSVGARRN